MMLLLFFEAVLASSSRPLGDSAVRARVPDPGFPEGIAVADDKFYVSSPAQLGHSGDARIFAFNMNNGFIAEEFRISTPNDAPTHGLVGVTLDGSGNLYVADTHRGVVRLDLSSGQTKTYAEIPDLPPCPLGLKLDGDCSPTLSNRPSFPNDLAFDGDGNLYVSDSFQATVWKIPPPDPDDRLPLHASPWFQDASLDGLILGPNGIRLTPDGEQLCIAVTGPPGSIHCVAFADLKDTVLRKYGNEGPDNMAFGQSRTLYVTLAFENQIEAIPPGSRERVQRYSGPATAPDGNVEWDAPAGVAFDKTGRSLLVTNHALNSGLVYKHLFVVFDVFVDDKASPLQRPKLLQVE